MGWPTVSGAGLCGGPGGMRSFPGSGPARLLERHSDPHYPRRRRLVRCRFRLDWLQLLMCISIHESPPTQVFDAPRATVFFVRGEGGVLRRMLRGEAGATSKFRVSRISRSTRENGYYWAPGAEAGTPRADPPCKCARPLSGKPNSTPRPARGRCRNPSRSPGRVTARIVRVSIRWRSGRGPSRFREGYLSAPRSQGNWMSRRWMAAAVDCGGGGVASGSVARTARRARWLRPLALPPRGHPVGASARVIC